MREDGMLDRVLPVYDHFIRQIDQKQDLTPEAISSAASIIRSFVEDYHQKQEEQFLFPRFEKAGVLTDLVPGLKVQHQAGRTLTDRIMSLAKSRGRDDGKQLGIYNLAQFTPKL